MSDRPIEERDRVRLLLGELEEAERALLEQNLLASEEEFERMESSEEDLIDDYLAGALPAEDRERFEKAYLSSPERRERIEFARALQQRLAERALPQLKRFPTSSEFSWKRSFLLAAAVVIAVVGGYFAVDSWRLRGRLARLQASNESALRRQQELTHEVEANRGRSQRLEQELARARQETELLAQQLAALRARASSTVTLALVAGLWRDSGGMPALIVPKSVAGVRLVAPVPSGAYRSYRAVIHTPERREIWRGTVPAPPPPAKSVELIVPAELLPTGDYILALVGTAGGSSEPVADFPFRVRRQ